MIDDASKERILSLWNMTGSVSAVAKSVGISYRSVYGCLKKNIVGIREKGISIRQKNIENAYKLNPYRTVDEIASAVKMSSRTVRVVLRKKSIDPVRRLRKDKVNHRSETMYREYLHLGTLDAVARKYNLSKERVRQILRDSPYAHRKKPKTDTTNIGKVARKIARMSTKRSLEQIADAVQLSKESTNSIAFEYGIAIRNGSILERNMESFIQKCHDSHYVPTTYMLHVDPSWKAWRHFITQNGGSQFLRSIADAENIPFRTVKKGGVDHETISGK